MPENLNDDLIDKQSTYSFERIWSFFDTGVEVLDTEVEQSVEGFSKQYNIVLKPKWANVAS